MGTLAIRSAQDANRQYFLPDKSGTFPISGTFTVNLPTIAALSISGTNVVVAGIREEDALVCGVQNMGTTTTASDMGHQGFSFLAGSRPYNGGVNLTFVNPTTTATAIQNYVIAFTAMR